jgi:anti-sigma-K factor RskA
MTDNLHIADADLTLYAMGGLSPQEMEQARLHLLSCDQCREELRLSTLTLAAYAQATPEAGLPQGARDRFMARLAQTPQIHTVAQAEPVKSAVAPLPTKPAETAQPRQSPTPAEPASVWTSLFGTGGWSLALAGAMAVLLVVVGVDDMRNRAAIGPLQGMAQRGEADTAQLNQLMELLTSSQAKRVALHPGPVTAPPPDARVTYAARTGKLLLTASNLHPLPAGKVYELWILQPGGKKPLPAGTFAPDSTGNATMILADAPTNLAVQGFGVTVENAGGSDTPTLPIVLSGF